MGRRPGFGECWLTPSPSGREPRSLAVTCLAVAVLLEVSAAMAQPISEDGDGPPLKPEAAASDPDSTTTPQDVEPDCTPACRAGFVCVDEQCVSGCNPPCPGGQTCNTEMQCVDVTPVDYVPVEHRAPDPTRSLTGVHGFGGILLGGGITLHTARATSNDDLGDPTTWGAFLFALRAGVTIERAEVAIELAPQTFRPVLGGSAETALHRGEPLTSFTGGVGYHIPLTTGAYWPLRIGAGLIADGDDTVFQGRLDLFNISVKTQYVLLDFAFPSIRYQSDFDLWHRWTGLFNVGVAYISP